MEIVMAKPLKVQIIERAKELLSFLDHVLVL
jgi:hypothetical protein